METDLLVQVIISLMAVIASLVGVIKFYLPRHDRKLQNPWAERLLEEMGQLRQEAAIHHVWERAALEELRRIVERIGDKGGS